MNLSFIATIAFALLTLGMAFLANLLVLLFTGSQYHLAGVLFAIIASGLSYVAQHWFTESAQWLTHYQVTTQPGYSGAAHPDAFELHTRKQRHGTIAQLLAVALVVASIGVLWVGLP